MARPPSPGEAKRQSTARRRGPVSAFLAGLALIVIAHPGIGLAQEPDPENVKRGLEIYKEAARCSFCHGWDGKGALVEGMRPPPSLVEMELEREDFIEAVKCGRPGTGMPRHHRQAWKGTTECYGLTVGDLGGVDVPNDPFAWLRDRQIEVVADFVFSFYKGKEMDLANCELYQGEGARYCDEFRK